MLTKEEFKKEYIRMMDSMRVEHKGSFNCDGLFCDECPINNQCTRSVGLYNVFDIIEAVEQWSKEHLVITMNDKFKAAFGVVPKNSLGDLCCPRSLGFLEEGCCSTAENCKSCKEQFWSSEYKEPEKEDEDV